MEHVIPLIYNHKQDTGSILTIRKELWFTEDIMKVDREMRLRVITTEFGIGILMEEEDKERYTLNDVFVLEEF